jgi:hypothetical protein
MYEVTINPFLTAAAGRWAALPAALVMDL